jgi:AcrR family transcriptional regulator
MPPKVKVTKEDIIQASVELVRKKGTDAINARTIASALNGSTQPIFSNFESMEELRGRKSLVLKKEKNYDVTKDFLEQDVSIIFEKKLN